jgi:hypothetical protein
MNNQREIPAILRNLSDQELKDLVSLLPLAKELLPKADKPKLSSKVDFTPQIEAAWKKKYPYS